jgi:hypothetical protein
VGINELTITLIDSFEGGDLLSDELVQSGDVHASAALMMVKVVIADMRKEVAIVEDANSGQPVICITHSDAPGAGISPCFASPSLP